MIAVEEEEEEMDVMYNDWAWVPSHCPPLRAPLLPLIKRGPFFKAASFSRRSTSSRLSRSLPPLLASSPREERGYRQRTLSVFVCSSMACHLSRKTSRHVAQLFDIPSPPIFTTFVSPLPLAGGALLSTAWEWYVRASPYISPLFLVFSSMGGCSPARPLAALWVHFPNHLPGPVVSSSLFLLNSPPSPRTRPTRPARFWGRVMVSDGKPEWRLREKTLIESKEYGLVGKCWADDYAIFDKPIESPNIFVV